MAPSSVTAGHYEKNHHNLDQEHGGPVGPWEKKEGVLVT